MPCSSRRRCVPAQPPARDAIPVKRHPHPICIAPCPTPLECQLQEIQAALDRNTALLQEIHLLLLQAIGNNL